MLFLVSTFYFTSSSFAVSNRVGLNLNFEFESALKLLMNLNFVFSNSMNLNFFSSQ